MARVAGVDIPDNKRVVISLTYIYGIGKSLSQQILNKLKIDENIRVKDLSDAQLGKIRAEITNYTVEGDLRREVAMSIRSLVDTGLYRGLRHKKGLPVRGQNTRNNARTRKGKKVTVAGKKKAPIK